MSEETAKRIITRAKRRVGQAKDSVVKVDDEEEHSLSGSGGDEISLEKKLEWCESMIIQCEECVRLTV